MLATPLEELAYLEDALAALGYSLEEFGMDRL